MRLRVSGPSWSSPKVGCTEILADLVIVLALIPAAISCSVIAGVDPSVGLFASYTMAVVISIPQSFWGPAWQNSMWFFLTLRPLKCSQ
ncbi:sulfate transporter [Amycolatopsis decaplanina DSM 44594]|uniref:Sulfate transporter n=1 Tax=Amycolatopsis decaplanina DSM 44594 TaxID=1284240 RepID=M2YIP9_9PSEU|nr:sulfate transporter [Amycolatopsis decaplanina DSM 44594]